MLDSNVENEYKYHFNVGESLYNANTEHTHTHTHTLWLYRPEI